MDLIDRCPCGRKIDNIIKSMIDKGGICPDQKSARKNMEDLNKDIDKSEYIFDCYKTSRERFKNKFGECEVAPDPRKIICNYRYILFPQEKEANLFYEEFTYDVGQRLITSMLTDEGKTIWLIRFIDKIQALVINNISGFYSHGGLVMTAGALSDSIGIETTIYPRYKGERAVSRSKNNWNQFCQVLFKMDATASYCSECSWKENNFIMSGPGKSSVLKNQEPQTFSIDSWCGLYQIAVPILVNDRWIATAISGGLWNKDFTFEKFLDNVKKNEDTYTKFKQELTALEPAYWPLEQRPDTGETYEKRIERLRIIYNNLEQSERFNPPNLENYKESARKYVLAVQDVLEEKYASIRQMKNEYWLERLILDWERQEVNPKNLWGDVYKKLILPLKTYGQFKESYFFINYKNTKRQLEIRRTFKIYSRGQSLLDFKLPGYYKLEQKFFTEPIKIYHLTDFNQDEIQHEDIHEYELIRDILDHLNHNDPLNPAQCAVVPLVLSKEDKRFGIAIFWGRTLQKPEHQDRISPYIRALLLSFRRFFLDRVKISYEEIKKQESYEAQRSFLDFLNHEIAITLSYWNGSLQWIEREITKKFGRYDTESFIRRIEDQRQQADQLNKLIGDLALINILNEGALKINPEEFDLFEIIKRATHTYTTNAIRKALDFNFGNNLKISAKLDPGLMERVFGNLVRNAIQYGYRDTFIKFRRYDTFDSVNIAVISHGIPVEKEFEERIFERGFRSPKAQEHCTGTGYGLWLSREILRAHGEGFDLFYKRSTDSGTESIFVIKIPKRYII